MKKLKIIVEESNINFFTWGYHGLGFQQTGFPKIGRYLIPTTFMIIKNNDMGKFVVNEEEWVSRSKLILEDIKSGELDCKWLNKESEKVGENLMRYCKSLENTDLNKADEKELLKHLRKLYEEGIKLVAYGGVAVIADYQWFILSNYLSELIKNRIEKYKLLRKVQEYLNVITSTTSLSIVEKQNIELLEIAKKFKNGEDIRDELTEHTKKYSWIEYSYQGPAKDYNDFLKEIRDIVKRYEDIDDIIDGIKNSKKIIFEKQRKFLEELNANEDDKVIFEAARIFLYMKGYRISVRHRVHAMYDDIFRMLSKLKNKDIKYFRAMSIDEVEEFVINDKLPENLEERFIYMGMLGIDGKISKFIYGNELNKFIEKNIEKEEIKETDILYGQTACLGSVIGKAKIVNRIEDIKKMEKGDILVSIQTNPDLVPAMEKAAGFVTNTGGLTCHAAIIAREMNKPCVTGTNIATKVIKDGDIIQINAHHGSVRILKRFKK